MKSGTDHDFSKCIVKVSCSNIFTHNSITLKTRAEIQIFSSRPVVLKFKGFSMKIDNPFFILGDHLFYLLICHFSELSTLYSPPFNLKLTGVIHKLGSVPYYCFDHGQVDIIDIYQYRNSHRIHVRVRIYACQR